MKIAIIGATGLVGRTVLKILDEHGYITGNQIVLYASNKHKNQTLEYKNQQFCIRELCQQNIDKDISFAFFCAGTPISKVWTKEFAKNQTIIIDNSNAFRRYKNIPLVIPEINMNSIQLTNKIIANPNCSTIGMCLVLFYLQNLAPIRRVVVSTYQAVSGAGQKGIDDLINNTSSKFNYQINNNLLPHIDKFLYNGYTKEEDKMMFETSKILNKKIPICATAVRVPIKNCHSESINIEFTKPVSVKKIREYLSNKSGIVLLDDPANNLYPMPQQANEKNSVFVGRIRKDYSQKNSINLFICFDNVRKGAGLNAVQIMTNYIQKFYSI